MTASPDPERADLDARVLTWIREPGWKDDEARFDSLARELFAFQFERCAPFARYCEGRGRRPATVASWREIPPVPTGAFKELAVRSFPPERTVQVFRTSGTSTSVRGELHLDTLELYEASLLASFRRHLLPDLDARGGRVPIRVLAPAPEKAPDSSLSHMFGAVVEAFGSEDSGFDLRDNALCADALGAALSRCAREARPLVLCGTAFAFVHLLEELQGKGNRYRLPAGSRVMETGGFKGRAREMPRGELYAAIEAGLGVPPERVVNQYGMTELGSQFYDSVLLFPDSPRRKLRPPWTRVRIVDPESGLDAEEGGVGFLCIVDLASTGSVLSIQTADLGRRLGDRFEVLGRESGAEARGCSLAADEMLADGRA